MQSELQHPVSLTFPLMTAFLWLKQHRAAVRAFRLQRSDIVNFFRLSQLLSAGLMSLERPVLVMLSTDPKLDDLIR